MAVQQGEPGGLGLGARKTPVLGEPGGLGLDVPPKMLGPARLEERAENTPDERLQTMVFFFFVSL